MEIGELLTNATTTTTNKQTNNSTEDTDLRAHLLVVEVSEKW